MLYYDWQNATAPAYLDFFESSAAEAARTGLGRSSRGGRIITSLGSKNCHFTQHRTLVSRQRFHSAPITARNLAGRTGRGTPPWVRI